MADQNARQDENKIPALIAHLGTAGTAETVRVVASDAGALRVDLVSGDTINIGTMTVGTIDNVVDGTLSKVSSVTEVSNLASGTISEITNGSIIVTAGTITTAASDIPGGTIDVLSALTTGSVVVTAGTVDATLTGDLSGGTVDLVSAIAAGSVAVTAGTVKIDGRPNRNVLTYGTAFGGTAAAYGTLIGSALVGAGTYLWLNDLSMVNRTGTVGCQIGFGTALNGDTVLAKGKFGANSGIQKSYPLAVNGNTTNQDLVCYIDAAGTVDISVSYFLA